jgi:hypothetical protein
MGQQPLIAPPDRPGDRSTEIAAHTPGPWEWSGPYYGDGGGQFRRLEGANETVIDGEWGLGAIADADARLISAAPDMLAALQLAADSIKELDGGDQRSETGWRADEHLDTWLKIRAAIAKATGG